MPLVLGFYFGLALLEDSGYLPRLAVLTDGLLSRLGMNGRAIIPLILGGGCVTMAVVTTRLLKSNKEKIITMALLGLTIPCSAQLGVIQGLLSNVGGILPWLIWGLTLFIVFGVTGLIMNKVIEGDCGNFISDIPPMRVPRLSNISKKTLTRSKVFLDEATPAFFIAAAVVAFLQVTGCLEFIIKGFEPVISNVLLLPKEVALSFILGMIRRDFGAFGLLSIPMSASQLVTACVVLTLFVPCIATVAVMIKEKNFKTALAIWLSSWILALGLGAFLARLLNALGI
jgi:ferrous iron transport protein B